MRNGASDMLYHAHSLSTEEVLDLYQAQIVQEMYPYKEDTSDPQMEQFDRLIAENEEAVQIARAIYEQYGDVDEGIAAMCEHENEIVRGIGDAIFTGNYSNLAM